MTEPSISVRDAGAVGDGKTDDTAAVRAALDRLPRRGGTVVFPPGHYLLDTIKAPDFVTFRGEGGWSYKEPGATVLSPLRPDQPALFDLHNNKGARLVSLALDGRKLGGRMHAIVSSKVRGLKDAEQNFVLDDLWISHFTGSGLSMEHCHVWCVRHCDIQFNGLDGIDAHHSYDAWIIDNQIGHNGRYGIYVASSTTITGNRIEQNGAAGIRTSEFYLEDTVITGNHFCSERGPAIEIAGDHPEANVRGLTVTGNLMRNSARDIEGDDPRNCHLRLSNVAGVTCTGNMFHALRKNTSPRYGIVLDRLTNCVIANNSLHKGAMNELIHDLGGHEGTLVASNVGSLKDPTDERA